MLETTPGTRDHHERAHAPHQHQRRRRLGSAVGAACLLLLLLPGLASAQQGVRGTVIFDPFVTPWEPSLLELDPPYCTVWDLSGVEVTSFAPVVDGVTGAYEQALDPGDWKIHCAHFYRAYGKWSGDGSTFLDASVVSIPEGIFVDGVDFSLPHRPFLEPFLNDVDLTTGETLVVDFQVANGPFPRELFMTFELILPAPGLASYDPLGRRKVVTSRNLPVDAYQNDLIPNFFSYTFTGAEPAGTYLVRTGWTDLGEYDSDVLANQSQQQFEITFTP